MPHLDFVSYFPQFIGVSFGFALLFLLVVFVGLPPLQRQLIIRAGAVGGVYRFHNLGAASILAGAWRLW